VARLVQAKELPSYINIDTISQLRSLGQLQIVPWEGIVIPEKLPLIIELITDPEARQEFIDEKIALGIQLGISAARTRIVQTFLLVLIVVTVLILITIVIIYVLSKKRNPYSVS
jgi:hypothetical protein